MPMLRTWPVVSGAANSMGNAGRAGSSHGRQRDAGHVCMDATFHGLMGSWAPPSRALAIGSCILVRRLPDVRPKRGMLAGIF